MRWLWRFGKTAAMKAYNPQECAKRLETAGIVRPHAEAIAAEIYAAKSDLATKLQTEGYEATLDRATVRLCFFTLALTSLACAILGVVFSN